MGCCWNIACRTCIAYAHMPLDVICMFLYFTFLCKFIVVFFNTVQRNCLLSHHLPADTLILWCHTLQVAKMVFLNTNQRIYLHLPADTLILWCHTSRLKIWCYSTPIKESMHTCIKKSFSHCLDHNVCCQFFCCTNAHRDGLTLSWAGRRW